MEAVITDAEALANISANVQRLRGDKSYSQLARECSTDDWKAYPSTIEHIDKGRHMPGAGLLKRLAEALGVSTEDLLAPPPGMARRRVAKAS